MALSLKASKALRIPFIWFWPEGKKSCAIVTHDVETKVDWTSATPSWISTILWYQVLLSTDSRARYTVSTDTLESIRGRGFEINVHGFQARRRLFGDWNRFQEQARQINEYAKKFGSSGFRSGGYTEI